MYVSRQHAIRLTLLHILNRNGLYHTLSKNYLFHHVVSKKLFCIEIIGGLRARFVKDNDETHPSERRAVWAGMLG